MREIYLSDIYRLNDFLFHIGNYNFKLVTAIPEKMIGYATILKPYDIYSWAFIGLSVIAVMFTMVAIEHTSYTWIGQSAVSSLHQCRGSSTKLSTRLRK